MTHILNVPTKSNLKLIKTTSTTATFLLDKEYRTIYLNSQIHFEASDITVRIVRIEHDYRTRVYFDDGATYDMGQTVYWYQPNNETFVPTNQTQTAEVHA